MFFDLVLEEEGPIGIDHQPDESVIHGLSYACMNTINFQVFWEIHNYTLPYRIMSSPFHWSEASWTESNEIPTTFDK